MGETFLITDVESGSVATALAHLPENPQELPRLFGEKRVPLPFVDSMRTEALITAIDRALEEALSFTTHVAAHARGREDTAHFGELSCASVFLSAPWAALTPGNNRLRWEFEPVLLQNVRERLGSRIAPHKILVHPFGRAAARAAYEFGILNALVGHVSAEVTEFISADDGKVIARATVPLGTRGLVRTLRTHAGLTVAEAHSALALARELDGTHPYGEPMRAAAKQYADEYSTVARELTRGLPTTLLIIAPHPVDDFVARALANHAGPAAFPEGSSVRALSSRHLEPLLSAHSTTRDLPLMLEALFTARSRPVVQYS